MVRTVADFFFDFNIVAGDNINIYNRFKKNILTTNTSGNQTDRGMVARIRNLAVCYRLRENEARPRGVFVFKRQNKEKL